MVSSTDFSGARESKWVFILFFFKTYTYILKWICDQAIDSEVFSDFLHAENELQNMFSLTSVAAFTLVKLILKNWQQKKIK